MFGILINALGHFNELKSHISIVLNKTRLLRRLQTQTLHRWSFTNRQNLPIQQKRELRFSSVGIIKLIYFFKENAPYFGSIEVFGFVCARCSKKYLQVLFFILVLFCPKYPIVEAFLVQKQPKSWKINFGQ